jgi:hypothetical protein
MHWEAGANRTIDWASATKSIPSSATQATCVTTLYWNNPGLVQHVVVPTAPAETQPPAAQPVAADVVTAAAPAADVASAQPGAEPEPISASAATAEDANAADDSLVPVAKLGSELNIGEGIQQAVMVVKQLFGMKKEEEQAASGASKQEEAPAGAPPAFAEAPVASLSGAGTHQPVDSGAAVAAEPAPVSAPEAKSASSRARTGRAPSPRRTSPAPAVPRVGGVQPPEDMAAHESKVSVVLGDAGTCCAVSLYVHIQVAFLSQSKDSTMLLRQPASTPFVGFLYRCWPLWLPTRASPWTGCRTSWSTQPCYQSTRWLLGAGSMLTPSSLLSPHIVLHPVPAVIANMHTARCECTAQLPKLNCVN